MRSPSFVPVARPYSLICAVMSIALATAVPASAQQLSGWTGAIRCEIQAQAQGYSHRETQTWTLTGAAPTVQGSVTAYPTTWTVVGGGQHDRSTPATRRIAQWTASVAGVSAPIGFTQHALGRTFDVSKWHAQLTRGGGYTGSDQFINGGVPSSSQPLVATVYEWQFPKIDAAMTDTQLDRVEHHPGAHPDGPAATGRSRRNRHVHVGAGPGISAPAAAADNATCRHRVRGHAASGHNTGRNGTRRHDPSGHWHDGRHSAGRHGTHRAQRRVEPFPAAHHQAVRRSRPEAAYPR